MEKVVPDIRVYFFGCEPVYKNGSWSMSTCKEEEVFSLVKVIAPLSKTLLEQGSVRTIPIHARDIPHTHRAFLDRYFSGTRVACFSQSSLLQHLLLLCVITLYYAISTQLASARERAPTGAAPRPRR